MLGFIGRLVARPVRVIFTYSDGQRQIAADPLVILRKLEEHGGENWHALIEAAAKKPNTLKFDIPMAEEAMRKKHAVALGEVAEMARDVFGLKPIAADGSGLTEAEQIAVLAQYLQYVGGLAQRATPLPISPAVASSSAPQTVA